MNEHNAEPAWREHPTALYVWWLVDKTGALIAEVGSVNVGGGGAWYAVVGKDRLPLKYASKEAAQRAAETALAAPVKPEAAPAPTLQESYNKLFGAVARAGFVIRCHENEWRIEAAAPALPAQAQPERATVLEQGLRELLSACDKANERAIAKLGGIVIDLSDIVRAESALAGERVVAFCGGHRNVLSDAVYVEPKLDQDWDAQPASPAPVELVRVLRGLAANAGALRAFEPEVRQAIGNTNWQAIADYVKQADDLLAASKDRS